jgi:uncharacterized glyoxalase superfamily protein PhnB
MTTQTMTTQAQTTPAKTCPSTIVPSLRYRDALAAIDWLVRAFGFERQAVFVAPDNKTVQHAQLTFGNGMIMLGSVDNGGQAAKFMVQPDEVGLRETKSTYYGGRGFTCRDLEGHIWSIGTYDPWDTAKPE